MPSLYRDLLRPLLFRVDAEKVHEFGLRSLRIALASKAARQFAAKRFKAPEGLETYAFGLQFKNPVGIAAGFDKNGVAVNQLAALGFGFVEIGTVTQFPQPGNPKPRLFRLAADRALINRLGFNNAGAKAVAENLETIEKDCLIGINIGRNKAVENEMAVESYVGCLEVVSNLADYITVNVSSPNTPELRRLHSPEHLDRLLEALQAKSLELAGGTERKKPLLLKIAPDLSSGELDRIIDSCERNAVEGIIATNTTVGRRGLSAPRNMVEKIGQGGLSGQPLRTQSTEIIRNIYQRTGGAIPIIGVGGIFSAADAFEKIASGASLVQGYTGFVYRGPSYAHEINMGLRQILDERGFETIGAAVGSEP